MNTKIKRKFLEIAAPFWLLSLAVLLTISLAWLIYPLEISWQHLTIETGLSRSRLMVNFSHLMQYLILPWVRQLTMPDFPSSESGLSHFADVKHLFHLTQAVFLLLAYPAVRFLWQSLRAGSILLYYRLYVILAALPVTIALLVVLFGFEQFFTLFHQLLFPGNDSWLFDPYTDPVIWALPQDYFLHCFMIFFLIYEGFFGGMAFYCRYKLTKKTPL